MGTSNYEKNLYHLLGCILKLSKCFKKYCKETYKACSVSWVLWRQGVVAVRQNQLMEVSRCVKS